MPTKPELQDIQQRLSGAFKDPVQRRALETILLGLDIDPLVYSYLGNVIGLSGPNTIVADGRQQGIRPRFLVMGNSLAGLSNTGLVQITTTLSVVAPAGSTSVTVTAIGAIANTNKIAIQLYDGTIFTTTVSGAPVGAVVTLAAPLPKMARALATFNTYTTVNPTAIRRSGGPLYCALASLGMPVDLIQGYGYGGGLMPEIMLDLPRVLEATRPQYVHFIDSENSLNTLTAAQCISLTKYKIRTCLCYGAVPIVNTAYPSSSYSGGAYAAFDAYNTYITGQMLIDFPQAFASDVGKQWLDSAQPSVRTPLAGWTDGIHPNSGHYATIGVYYAAVLAAILPTAQSISDYALTANPTMSGSGGTGSGMQGGSVVPASWTYTAQAGVTATSSVGPNGGSRVVVSVPGTSNISTTQFTPSQVLTFSPNVGSQHAVMAYAKIKINTLTGIDMLYPQVVFSGGEAYSSGQDGGGGLDPAMVGSTYQLETPMLLVPPGSTNVTFSFPMRPSSGLANGVFVDIEILEMGIVPAPYVTH